MDRAKFDELVRAADERKQLAAAGAAHLERVEYHARLAADQSLVGTADLVVKLVGEWPQVLELSPCNVAITGARREDGASDAAPLGAWSEVGARSTKYGVLTPRSGQLALAWQSPADANAGAELEFALRLPVAPMRRFTLDLPADYSASIEPGFLVTATPDAATGENRWTFQLAAGEEFRLRIHRPERHGPEAPLPMAAVAEAYRLMPDGLAYDAELRIQSRGIALNELRASVPPSLQIIEVLVDRATVAHRRDEHDATTLVVPLAAAGGPHSVQIRAAAPLVLDRPWTLPNLMVQDAAWTEGGSTLWIDPALELRSLAPRQAKLLNLIGIGGYVRMGEAYRLQAWSGEASTEVLVSKRPAVVHGQSGVVAEFTDREIVARTSAKLWAEHGRLLHIAAAVESDWRVESVDATPEDAVTGWHVAGDEGQRHLHIELRHSPTALAPLTLKVAGRKTIRSFSRRATVGELAWLDIPHQNAATEFLFVKDRRGGQVIAGPSLTGAVVAADSLGLDERQFYPDAASGLLLAVDAAPPEAVVRVASRPPRYQAEVWMALEHTASGFEHRTEVLCRPTLGSVSDVTLKFARPLPSGAIWEVDASNEGLSAELAPPPARPAPTEQPAQAPGATYRVMLARPRSEPFRLRVAWRGDRQGTDSINAVAVLSAESWQGWAILGGDPHEVQVDPRGCTPAATGSASLFDSASETIGSFRLGDDGAAPTAEAPSIKVVEPTGDDAGGGVYCWYCEMATTQFTDGNQTHHLVYHLERYGGDEVEIALPPGVEMVAARLDDAEAAVDLSAVELARSRIRLPPGRRYLTLAVDLRAARSPLGFEETIAPPTPTTSFKVLRGRWTLWSPTSYAFENARHSSNADNGWLARLFGPLAPEVDDNSPELTESPHRQVTERDNVQPTDGDGRLTYAAHAPVGPSGWSSASQEFVKAPEPMRLRHLDNAKAAWYAMWLGAAVAAACLWPRQRRWVASAIAAAAIICLTFPPGVASAAQATLLGALSGTIIRSLVGKAPNLVNDSTRSAAKVAGWACLLLMGATSPAAAELASSAPPSVLYPIDGHGEPAEKDVYVPASLWAELSQAIHRAPFGGASAVLVDARCQLVVQREPTRGEAICESGVLILKLHTFVPNVWFELPLIAEEANWLTERHALDGLPAKVKWNEAGGCAVTVVEPGEHELRLHMIPRCERRPGRTRLRLHVPRIAGVTVEIVHPQELEELVVASSVRKSNESTAGRTVALVSGADYVEAAWRPIPVDNVEGASVDQLAWLHVEPVTARLEVRLRLTGETAAPHILELAIAPQLKLLPLPESSPVQEIETFPGAPTIVQLKFRTPPSLPLVMPLEFQLQRTVSTGRLEFPTVRVLGIPTRSSFVAVSADPRLKILDRTLAGLTPVATSEIEELWGESSSKSEVQFAVGEAPAWSLEVEPLAARYSSQESLELVCTADHARVEYAADVRDVAGDVLMHRVRLPGDISVEEVSVMVGDGEGSTPLRWSRPSDDLLCVFLGQPLAQPHRLRITGRLPYNDDSRLRIPRMTLESAMGSDMNLIVSRMSDVLVKWSDVPETRLPLPAADRDADADHDDEGGIVTVGRYVLAKSDSQRPMLEIAPNEVRLEADALITLDMEPIEPIAACLIRGKVTRGVLDRIRLRAPRNWRGPFVVEPAGVVVVRYMPDDATHQMIEVQLAQPVEAGSELKLRMAGAIALEADQRVRFPEVQLVDAQSQRTYLRLPETSGQQMAEWTLRGVRAATLPQRLAELLGRSSAPTVYRAFREGYVAEQRVFPEVMRDAQVRLAKIRVVLGVQRDWVAVAEVVVQPGRFADCGVALPEDAELVYMAVDGRPVNNPIVSDGAWSTPAGPPYLPRVLTVGYRQRVADPAAFRLKPPQVMVGGQALPAGRCYWQIESHAAVELASPRTGSELSSFIFEHQTRMDRISAVVDASPLALQLSEWESRQWFRPWLERLRPSADETDDLPARNSAERRTVAAWDELYQQLSATIDVDDVRTPPQRLHEWVDPPHAAHTKYYRAASDGTLSLAASSNSAAVGRWLAAALTATVSIAAWRRPGTFDRVADFLGRWPWAIGVAAGLFWWFMLSPSAIGLVIAVLSLAACFRNFKSSAGRQETSQFGSAL